MSSFNTSVIFNRGVGNVGPLLLSRMMGEGVGGHGWWQKCNVWDTSWNEELNCPTSCVTLQYRAGHACE